MKKRSLSALLDANVLYPAPIRDLLLHLADAGLYLPKWTELIHDEWIQNLLINRPELQLHNLTITKRAMNLAFPDADVKGFHKHIKKLQLPDVDDRHVLAAAIQAKVDFLVTVTGFLMQIEHKAIGWKQLLTLPLNKGAIYVSKLFIIVLTVILCYGLFILFTLSAGVVLNLIHPGLKFLSYSPEFALIFLITLKSFISTLGLISFQYWLSLRFKNFIIPIGIGIAGIILSFIIMNHWKYEDFFLYLQPALSLLHRPKATTDFILAKNEWISMIYFLIFSLTGYFDFIWKKRY